MSVAQTSFAKIIRSLNKVRAWNDDPEVKNLLDTALDKIISQAKFVNGKYYGRGSYLKDR